MSISGKGYIEFPTSDEDSSTPDRSLFMKYTVQGDEFPTSDEDSSTPDLEPWQAYWPQLICFRPLTRIHLLLTQSRINIVTFFPFGFRPLTRIHLLLTPMSMPTIH